MTERKKAIEKEEITEKKKAIEKEEITEQKKTTGELDEILKNMKADEVKKYRQENKSSLLRGEREFYYYFQDMVQKKHLQMKEVYRNAGYSESYGGQIVRCEKHTSNRDTILRLCIGAHFTLDETNRALVCYELPKLYSKRERDACIILQINHRIYDIDRINEKLKEAGYSLLQK